MTVTAPPTVVPEATVSAVAVVDDRVTAPDRVNAPCKLTLLVPPIVSAPEEAEVMTRVSALLPRVDTVPAQPGKFRVYVPLRVNSRVPPANGPAATRHKHPTVSTPKRQHAKGTAQERPSY